MNLINKIKQLFTNLFSKQKNNKINSFEEPIIVDETIDNEKLIHLLSNSPARTDEFDEIPDFTQTQEYIDYPSDDYEPETIILKKDNPLEPYKHPYENWASFLSQNRPLSRENFDEIFDKHISLKKFTNEKKGPYLKKIYDDSKFIYAALEPIRNLKKRYTLDLTGGAVRDFVLDKDDLIKDLDFMVSFTWNQLIPIEDLIEIAKFTKEEISQFGLDEITDISFQKSKILELCIYRTSDIGDVYFNDFNKRNQLLREKTDNEYEDTIVQDRLISVIKTKGEKTNWPIDLLLTDYIKPAFLEDFDFDICKASICIVNDVYSKDLPLEYSHLTSRFNAPMNFWADVFNKKITFNCQIRTKRQIEKSLGNHLDRLKKKYSDFDINIVKTSDTCPHYEYAKAFHLTTILEEKLKPKGTFSKRTKI